MNRQQITPLARRWLGAVLLGTVLGPFAGAQPAAQGRALDIAVEDEADLWSRRDGSGYANDVVRAAYAAVGVEARLHVVPYARCKAMVAEGSVAACFSMSRDALLPTAIAFPRTPIFRCAADFYERADRPLGAKRLEDIPAGTVVGVVRGYEYPEAVHRLAQNGRITLAYSTSEIVNLRKLVAGRLGAVIVNENEIKTPAYVSARAGVTGKVRAAFTAGQLESFIGFNRRDVAATGAMSDFDRGVAIITSNGVLTRIHDDWVRRVAEEMGRMNTGARGS